MIESIQAFSKDEQVSWQLTGLGKINILCGKNNSGKTTILEAINTEDKRFVGKTLTSEDFKKFLNSTLQSMGWHRTKDITSHSQQCDIMYSDVLKKMDKKRKKSPCFMDEADLFVDILFGEEYKNIPMLFQHPLPFDMLKEAFRNLFISSLSTLLIPAKRGLTATVRNQSTEEMSPHGVNAVEELFTLYNQADKFEYNSITDAFYEISSGYKVHVFLDRFENNLRLNFSYQDEPATHADNWGLGLQDLLIILIHSIQKKNNLILIEEPENHIHAEMQKKLLHFLKEESDKQFIISSHSNIFLNTSFSDRIFRTYYDKEVKISDATSRVAILNDLGYSVTDNLISDFIILVEGPKDKHVLEEFLIKIGLYNKYNIKLWALGGDIMDQQDLSIFAERKGICALIDQDPYSESSRKKFIENCETYEIPVTRLKKYSIENYFTVRALRIIYGKEIPKSLKELNPDKKIKDQIRFKPNKTHKRIAQTMTLQEIKETEDLYDFLVKVGKLCEETQMIVSQQ